MSRSALPGTLLTALLFFLSIYGLTTVFLWRGDFEWHDQQRIAQLFLLCVSLLILMTTRHVACPPLSAFIILTILLIGLKSSINSLYPDWALIEWAHWVGLIALFLVLSSNKDIKLTFSLIYIVSGIAFLQAAHFLIFYIMAFATGIREINTAILIDGFTNIRFYGQFQTLSLPLLSFAALHNMRNSPKIGILLFLVLCVQWCIAISLGGRGMLTALAFSHTALIILAPRHWRLAVIQLASALIGTLTFILLFILIPKYLGIAAHSHEILRSGLSLRQDLWSLAWDIGIAHPWLGIGPMHYSAEIYSKPILGISAHAHQVILQWMVEWGIPAMLLACGLIVWGLQAGLRRLRQNQPNILDASLWVSLLGAWTLAQVDGVFIMPFTQTWLTAIAGLAAARWSRQYQFRLLQRIPSILLSAAALFVLAPMLAKEAPDFLDKSIKPATHHFGLQQRFWANGPLRANSDNNHLKLFICRAER